MRIRKLRTGSWMDEEDEAQVVVFSSVASRVGLSDIVSVFLMVALVFAEGNAMKKMKDEEQHTHTLGSVFIQ